MANISKSLLKNQKKILPLTDYKLAVGHICEVTFNSDKKIKGKIIKKHLHMYEKTGEPIYNWIYSKDEEKMLIPRSKNEYAFISLDESVAIDIYPYTFIETFTEYLKLDKHLITDNMSINYMIWETLTIKEIAIINYMTKIDNYDELSLLLDSRSHFIKITGYPKEIPGFLIDMDIGESFMDCRGEIFGAAFPYVFIFEMPMDGIGNRTFMPIDRGCFNNKNNREDSLSVDYIRKGCSNK